MPSLARRLRMSAVFASTQLWPMACAGSLPVCLSVTSTSVQSAATAISFLSNCHLVGAGDLDLADLVGGERAARGEQRGTGRRAMRMAFM